MPQPSSPPTKTTPSPSMMNPFNMLEGNFFDNNKVKTKNSTGLDGLFGRGGGYSEGYLGFGGPGTISNEEEDEKKDIEEKEDVEKNGIIPQVPPPTPQAIPQENNRHFRQQFPHPQNFGDRDFAAPPTQIVNQNPHFVNRNNKMPPDFGDRYSANRTKDNQRRNNMQKQNIKQNGVQSQGHGQGQSLPPRFKKMHPNSDKSEEMVSLRPQSGPLVFKPKTPSMLPKSAISKSDSGPGNPNVAPQMTPNAPVVTQNKVMMQQEAPIMIKQSTLDKVKKGQNKVNSHKGPTKDQVNEKVKKIVDSLKENNVDDAVEEWKQELDTVPQRLVQHSVTQFFKMGLELDLAHEFLKKLKTEGSVTNSQCREAFGKCLVEKVYSEEQMAQTGAKLIANDLVSLKDLAELCKGNVFLMILQKLKTEMGQNDMKNAFDAAFRSLNLADFVNAENEENLAEILEQNELTFLMPMLKVQQEMFQFLCKEGNSVSALTQWIEDNVDTELRNSSGFVKAIFTVAIRFIYETVTLKRLEEGSDPICKF